MCGIRYLPVVGEVETDAVVRIAPLEELVVVRRQVHAEGRSAEEAVELRRVDE